MSGGSSIPLSVGLAIQGLGLVLHIVATATTGWSHGERLPGEKTVDLGLWNACDYTDCKTLVLEDNPRAAKVFAIIGAVFGGGGTIFGMINVLISISKSSPNRILSVFCFIGTVVAFNTIDIAAAIWASGINARTNYSLGYSFGLALVGSFLLPIGGLFGLVISWQSPGSSSFNRRYY